MATASEFSHISYGCISYLCRGHFCYGLWFQEHYDNHLQSVVLIMSEITKNWYVVRAAGGKEKKAKEYIESEIKRLKLEDKILQVLIPT